jgi:hypothetical protein
MLWRSARLANAPRLRSCGSQTQLEQFARAFVRAQFGRYATEHGAMRRTCPPGIGCSGAGGQNGETRTADGPRRAEAN